MLSAVEWLRGRHGAIGDEGLVPGILLRHEDTWWFNDYFHHHHTTSDTIDHVDPALLKLNLQCVAAAAGYAPTQKKPSPGRGLDDIFPFYSIAGTPFLQIGKEIYL